MPPTAETTDPVRCDPCITQGLWLAGSVWCGMQLIWQPIPPNYWHGYDTNNTRVASIARTGQQQYLVKIYPDGEEPISSGTYVTGLDKAQAHAEQVLDHLHQYEEEENAKALSILTAL